MKDPMCPSFVERDAPSIPYIAGLAPKKDASSAAAPMDINLLLIQPVLDLAFLNSCLVIELL